MGCCTGRGEPQFEAGSTTVTAGDPLHRRQMVQTAGIKQHVTPHVGRGSVIIQALTKASLQVVARSIDHVSIESTARYDRNRMDEAIMTYQDWEL